MPRLARIKANLSYPPARPALPGRHSSWLAQFPPAWRDHVEVVAIDMCSIYASAVRRMLPDAVLVVDLFHVVQLAVKMTGDVRRRVTCEKYKRRGRAGDLEYGIKRLPVRAERVRVRSVHCRVAG